MKRMLKYLLPVIMAVVFWDCADKPESSVLETALSDLSSMTSACHADISAVDSEFCLPNQVSFTHSQRVQNAPRRTVGTHRSNLEFSKSGKVVNACLKYLVQKRSIIIHSSLMEPSHRLLYLGKLII